MKCGTYMATQVKFINFNFSAYIHTYLRKYIRTYIYIFTCMYIQGTYVFIHTYEHNYNQLRALYVFEIITIS